MSSVRTFDWRDLPALHRYRHKSVFLHSSLLVTRGAWTISGALLSSIAPTAGISTYVSVDNGDTDHRLIGQTIQIPGSQIAQLTFLAPDEALDSEALPDLLDHLSGQAISRGAFRLPDRAPGYGGCFRLRRAADHRRFCALGL